MRIRKLGREGMKVTCDVNGMLRYQYDAGPEMSFDFTLICECGEVYKNIYLRWFTAEGWVVEFGRDLDVYPWVADFLIEVKP